jgi:hypothetical protein
MKELPSESIIRIYATTYLGDPTNQKLKILSSVNATCIDTSQANANFTLDAVCFAQGRLITELKNNFSIGIADQDITFSMPFSGQSEAFITDINGKVITLLPMQERMSGIHTAKLPELSQGMYMIIARNGQYHIQKNIIIHSTSILH